MPETPENIAALEAIETALNTGKGKQLDDRGRELLDPRPVAPPVGYKRQPSMVEHIRNMVRSEMLAQAAQQADVDTFEEADDFDVGDDYDPRSPYEEVFEPPAPPPSVAPETVQAAPQGPTEVAPATTDPVPAAGSKAPPAPPINSAPT